MSVNVSHTLGNFGDLHIVQHNWQSFDDLRNHCLNTTCDASHEIGENGVQFLPEIQQILQQKLHEKKCFLTKLPDGYVVHTNDGNVVSVIKDEHLTKPLHLQDGHSEQNSKVFTYSLACSPDLKDNIQHFKFIKDCDEILPPNSITNYSNVDHVISKIAAAIPLTSEPRLIFHSPNFGNLHGYNLYGSDASSLKNIFLTLKDKTGGENMYDTPIKLPSNVISLLQIKNPEKKVCIAPLQNGIMGYSNKKNRGHCLMFLANSKDFHQSAPIHNSPNNVVQIFKLSYPDKSGPRIFVNTKPGSTDCEKCPYGTPPITTNLSVQEALNHIEYAMRKALLEHHNIGDYPDYCKIMKMINSL